MKDKAKKLKRLTLDMDEKFHKKLKLLAIKRNITMRTLALRAIIKVFEEENKYD